MLTIETRPYLLYETLAMIFRYVNRIMIHKTRENIHTNRLPDDHVIYRRMNRLQEIMDSCCADLDVEAPWVQRYFRRIETGCASEYTCLADLMTKSFFQYQSVDLDEEAQGLKDCWTRLKQNGYQMEIVGGDCLTLRPIEPGQVPQEMWDQIYSLNCLPEIRLEIGRFLSHFETCLDELVMCIRPYAEKLDRFYREETWIMDSAVSYWQEMSQTIPPEDILIRGGFVQEPLPIMPDRRLCLSLMNHDIITYACWKDAEQQTLLIYGCSLTTDTVMKSRYSEPAVIGAVLHSISEKNKFEILRRLSREPSYCQKLAEEIGCHTGNLSRYLGALWKEGFLIRREDETRVYYETDKENLEGFLQDVRKALFGQ